MKPKEPLVPLERTVAVDLGRRSYGVRVGPGLLGAMGDAVAALPGVTGAAIVTDSNVGPLYGQRVSDALAAAGVQAALIEFPAGEASKNLSTVAGVLDALLAITPAVDRATVVVALGGGVVGDLAGFVAAIALRGMRFYQCPTSLLADVDASVGGKTGVDHQAGKNLIGAFHQPAGVMIDVETLKTLPRRELIGGLAECVKHAVIRDASLLDYIEDRAEDILACLGDVMTELIARNVAIKAQVVADDEREAGQRAHLNYGHTVGHAIEAQAGYGELSHGQAVALGMVAANRLAVGRGLLDEQSAQRIERLLNKLELPTRRPGLDADKVWWIMQHDKKALAGRIRMVLPTKLGAAGIFDDTDEQALRDAIEYLGSP
jgi:3-dehydroquinate synthase